MNTFKERKDHTDTQDRLEYLRSVIEDQSISHNEIIELQDLAKYIDSNDTLLLEWAGIPEVI